MNDYTNKFDFQLGQALLAENKLHQRLRGAKIELKTESYLWERTGNIAIEFECSGKPSGIQVTQADYWAHELRRDGQTLLYMLWPTDVLKEASRAAYAQRGCVQGGDQGRAKMVLLSLNEIGDILCAT